MKPSEVIERLRKMRQFYLNIIKDDTAVEAVDVAIKAVEKQEKDRWHLVAKEGEPKGSGFYLLTSKDGQVIEDYYHKNYGHWSRAWQFGYEVVAWCPLPDPYEAEEEA